MKIRLACYLFTLSMLTGCASVPCSNTTSCFGIPCGFSGKLTAEQERIVPEALRGAFYVESVRDIAPAEFDKQVKNKMILADESHNGIRYVAMKDVRHVDFGNGGSGMMIVVERYRLKNK